MTAAAPFVGFRSPRRFRLWDHLAGHAQLVVRSPGEDVGGPHLDLLLSGVEYLRLPTRLDGIELVAPGPAEAEEVRRLDLPDRPEGRRLVVVVSAAGRFLVVAADLRIVESGGPVTATTLAHPEGVAVRVGREICRRCEQGWVARYRAGHLDPFWLCDECDAVWSGPPSAHPEADLETMLEAEGITGAWSALTEVGPVGPDEPASRPESDPT